MPGRGSVVVVIPAKDRAGVIGRALQSVRAQTVPPDEVIVVDDGSSDDTAAVARSFGATVLVHDAPRGSGPARNTGIEASDAEWVAFLDSDDEWMPTHLEYVRASAEGHVLVSSSAVDTNGRGRGNQSGTPLRLTPRRCFVPENPVVTSGTLAHRQELLDAGGFRPFRRAQDIDMWARLLERGPGLVLPEPTVVYHVPPGPTDPAGMMRDRAGLMEVVGSLSDRPWMTRSVRDAIELRSRWDDARQAMRERDAAGVWRGGSWIAVRPTTWPSLLGLLASRRLARRSDWRRTLDDHAATSATGSG